MTHPYATPFRDEWLTRLYVAMRGPMREMLDRKIPKLRVAASLPHGRRRAIGQAFGSGTSPDGVGTVIVSLRIGDSREASVTLAHEIVHQVVGVQHGHDIQFQRAAAKIGLTKPWTETPPTPRFWEWVEPLLADMPPYPAPALELTGGPKQSTRLLKFKCPDGCQVVRMTAKYAEFAPFCGVCTKRMDGPL